MGYFVWSFKSAGNGLKPGFRDAWVWFLPAMGHSVVINV